jgi:hypothetical protein
MLKYVSLATVLLLGSCTLFDFEKPAVSILTPEDGETVPMLFMVTGTASDAVGIRSVGIRIDDGEYAAADGSSIWQHLCSVSREGEHYITARVEDYSGNFNYTYITVTVDEP